MLLSIFVACLFLGIKQNASVAHTKLEQNVMKLDIRSHSPDYFKPGLPYHGKVKYVVHLYFTVFNLSFKCIYKSVEMKVEVICV